jgi:uncharacterized membrane protein
VGTQTLLSVFGLFAPADFSLSLTPASIRIRAKGSNTAQYTTTLAPQGGYAGTVSLSVSGLPSQATASFSPATITRSGTSALAITVNKKTPRGTYTLSIVGTDSAGNLIHNGIATLVVF